MVSEGGVAGHGSWRRLREHIVRDVLAPSHATGRQLLQLLVPWGRNAMIRPQIAAAITARVQLLSLVFAVLVPAWALLDLLVFDLHLGLRLAALRLASSAVFLALVWPYPPSLHRPYRQALLLLVAMLMVPPLFYLASLSFVDYAMPGLDETQRLVLNIYVLLPTLSLAGLAIFPLSALETVLIAVPIVAIAVFGADVSGNVHVLAAYGPTLWFMAMMVGVAAFSGMSQLHYVETLVRTASLDALTGARTRRSGMEELGRQWRLACAEDRDLAIAFIDLDHFKRINDTWGHEQGDRALRTLTRCLARALRRADVLVRWGGEEFVAVLPDMPAMAQRDFLQRLVRGGFGTRPDGDPITVSVGLADRRSDRTRRWEDLVELADQRMYAAKQAGRNRAVLADGSLLVLEPDVARGRHRPA